MCAYKLVTCEFKWWGLQTKVESMIMKVRERERGDDLILYSITG